MSVPGEEKEADREELWRTAKAPLSRKNEDDGEREDVSSIVLNLKMRSRMALAEICRSRRRNRLRLVVQRKIQMEKMKEVKRPPL
ncbi:hypothetical protein GW17_00049824 [Ensete ventricosum]|nr:hypothetical protein GW17_00049824 [Ensete ventricosum]